MYGSDEIYDALNVASVTALIDTYGDDEAPAIFADMVIPADIDEESKTINYYRSGPLNLALDEEIYIYTVNCRAKTYNDAETIMKAVADSINRTNYSGYFITCQALPVIMPQNEQDNYNCPLEITVKMN